MPIRLITPPAITVVTDAPPPIPVDSPGVVEYVSTSYPQLNSAANTVATFANGQLVLANANLNFNNTSTINVVSSANGTTQANIAFQVNISAVSGGTNSYEADILANGHLIIANANLNYNNTATINVDVTANGSSQANLAFNANVAAIAGPAFIQANTAYAQANAAYGQANAAYAEANTITNYLPLAGGTITGNLQILRQFAVSNQQLTS